MHPKETDDNNDTCDNANDNIYKTACVTHNCTKKTYPGCNHSSSQVSISRVRFAIGDTPQRHHTSLGFTIEARWTHMRWGRREVSPLTPKNVESLSRTLGKHCEHAWAYIKGFKNSIKQPPNKSIICKKGLKMYQIRTN